ncbi:hypothetical protein CDO52_25275 [Nocardiopsis gilva YIM 90087]|uniref:LppX_LprAFG lipoprotein n=1 Tax=Nocardiopsis gilva YIM 90087 TaxID=1235441 RepID=A0A223SC54_9ACTN|nr:hypothetical protein [Nocardiopsis gilva]ASU85675.1 hypothetical protein CDO52_25275 [Nocardiopsis gilva YIM 90087]
MLKKIAAAAAGAGLALAVSGCSVLPLPGLGGPSPLEVVKNMANDAEKADTYTASMTMSGSVGAQSMDMSADIDYTRNPEPTLQMEMDMQGQQATVLMRGTDMVMKADSMGMGQMGGDTPEWIRFDPGDQQVDVGSQDPLSEVEKLMAVKQAEEAGSQDIDGVPTTKYTGSYSTEEALQEVDDADAQQAAREQFEQAGVDTVEFEAYIDGDGLPRRVVTKLGDAFTSTVDFHSFNEPSEVQFPSESQIGSMDDLTPGLGGGSDLGGY